MSPAAHRLPFRFSRPSISGPWLAALALALPPSVSAGDAFRWVSHAAGDETVAAGGETAPASLSADGRFLAFSSEATTLVAGSDTPGSADVFLWDREGGGVILVSHAAGLPTTAANAPSELVALAADGGSVLFASAATNLVAGQSDSNGGNDLFLWDRALGTTTLVSRAASSATTAGNGAVGFAAVSGDGGRVAWSSLATNHVAGVTDTNGADDLFVWTRATGVTVLGSHAAGNPAAAANGASQPLFFSADGGTLLVVSAATNLVAGVSDTNAVEDAFLWQSAGAIFRLVSRSGASATVTGNGAAQALSVSADGGFVLFNSEATNHVNGVADTNQETDVFLWEGATGTVRLVSESAATPGSTGDGNAFAYWNALSADGRYATFISSATDLVPGQIDNELSADAFLWDRESGVASLLSHKVGAPLAAVDHITFPAHISADGETVIFTCYARAYELVAGVADPLTGVGDAFLWRRGSETLRLLSRSATAPTPSAANRDTYVVALSDDGRQAAFDTLATDLVAGMTDTIESDDVVHWLDDELFADGFGTGGLERWSSAAP